MSTTGAGTGSTGSTGIGLVGAGAMGAAHAREVTASVPGARVVAVVDADAERAGLVARASGAVVAADAEALVARDDVDAVIVAAPDPLHEELALLVLRAGKPLLCEKPLATSTAGTSRIVEAETALGRRLIQVGFMRRYDPALVRLRTAVAAGEVGTPRVVHCVHRNAASHPSATSEGVVSNSMVHELDQVPWLLDSPVTAITITAPPAVAGGFLDTQVAVLETAGGAVATVEVSVNARYGYDVGCEVVGSEGTLRLTAPYGLAARSAGRDGVLVDADFVARFADAYRLELQAWVESVRTGTPTGPSAWDGHLAAVVAEAGVASLQGGGRVAVEAGDVPDLYRSGVPA